MAEKLKILFLCTGNSCRSQMAEGWTRALKGNSIEVFSAGIETHGLNPMAVEVMAEAGVDISKHTSKHIDSLRDNVFDAVITVCDNARESCPFFQEPKEYCMLASPTLRRWRKYWPHKVPVKRSSAIAIVRCVTKSGLLSNPCPNLWGFHKNPTAHRSCRMAVARFYMAEPAPDFKIQTMIEALPGMRGKQAVLAGNPVSLPRPLSRNFTRTELIFYAMLEN